MLLLHEEVVPVCSPALLGARGKQLAPAAIARLPLLQQSTRPDGWRQWFDAQRVEAPRARSGPRYELFSMLAVAAAHGLGVALMPRMLIEPTSWRAASWSWPATGRCGRSAGISW